MGRRREPKKKKYVRRHKRVIRRPKVREHSLIKATGSGILDITVDDIRAMRGSR